MPRQKPRHLPTAEANFERWLITNQKPAWESMYYLPSSEVSN